MFRMLCDLDSPSDSRYVMVNDRVRELDSMEDGIKVTVISRAKTD